MKYTIRPISELDTNPKVLEKEREALWKYIDDPKNNKVFKRIFDNLAKV
ncbi:hypothetical protein ACUZ9N_02325 [Mycoplasmopsis gallinarum]